MVFPGRFSTGCSRCRRRKCDEKKPSCRRCDIYGKPCPGYTDTFHFRHGLTRNDYEASSSSSLSSSSSSDAVSLISPNHPHTPHLQHSRRSSADSLEEDTQVIYRVPQLCYDQVSLCYFIKRFVSPDAPDGVPGHLSFLPGLYDHHHQGLLEAATMSVAQMAAFNQFGHENFRTQSYMNFSRVIRMMQQAMQAKESITDDKVIAAVLLLCALKDISGEGSGDPNEHASGLFYLLEARGPDQIFSRTGAELFLLALLRLQIYSFLHEDERYSDPGGIASVLGVFDPLLRAFSLMSKTLTLRNALSHYLSTRTRQRRDSAVSWATSSDDCPEDDGTALIKRCFEALEDLCQWDMEAATYWEKTFEGRAVPTALGRVASGTTYYDAETACIIILIRSVRLILLVSMLVYYGRTHGPTADKGFSTAEDTAAWAACAPLLEDDLRKTMDDIVATVPYALGDIDADGRPASMPHDGAGAIIIVHPIRLVASCAYASGSQSEKATAMLTRINASIGIRSANGFFGGGQGVPQWERDQDFLRSMFLSQTNFLDSWNETPMLLTSPGVGGGCLGAAASGSVV